MSILGCVRAFSLFLVSLSAIALGHAVSAQTESPAPATQSPGWSSLNLSPVTIEEGRAYQAQLQAKLRAAALRYSKEHPKSRRPTLRQSSISGASTLQAPISIPNLGRALRYDIDLIYQYVHDNIQFSPVYGVQKGALGALIDGVGTPFDQAALMAELLLASGYSSNDVKYQYGVISLTPAQFASWYGVDASLTCSAWYVPVAAGVPRDLIPNSPDSCVPLQAIKLNHVWIKVKINGSWYVFDPSFKAHTIKTGLSHSQLGAALSYDQTSFINHAKSAQNFNYAPGLSVDHLDNTAISSDLNQFSSNLSNYIKSNAIAQVDDLIGGRVITPVADPVISKQRIASLSYQDLSVTPDQWDYIPNSFRIQVQVVLNGQGIDYGAGADSNQWLFSDMLAGKRLTISFSGTGPFVPELRLDGQLLASGTAMAAGAVTTMSVTATHLAYSGATQTAAPAKITAGGDRMFLVANAWGLTGRGAVQYH